MDEHVGGVQVSSHIVRPRPHEKSLALPWDGEWQVRCRRAHEEQDGVGRRRDTPRLEEISEALVLHEPADVKDDDRCDRKRQRGPRALFAGLVHRRERLKIEPVRDTDDSLLRDPDADEVVRDLLRQRLDARSAPEPDRPGEPSQRPAAIDVADRSSRGDLDVDGPTDHSRDRDHEMCLDCRQVNVEYVETAPANKHPQCEHQQVARCVERTAADLRQAKDPHTVSRLGAHAARTRAYNSYTVVAARKLLGLKTGLALSSAAEPWRVLERAKHDVELARASLGGGSAAGHHARWIVTESGSSRLHRRADAAWCLVAIDVVAPHAGCHNAELRPRSHREQPSELRQGRPSHTADSRHHYDPGDRGAERQRVIAVDQRWGIDQNDIHRLSQTTEHLADTWIAQHPLGRQLGDARANHAKASGLYRRRDARNGKVVDRLEGNGQEDLRQRRLACDDIAQP